jgi:hypothetical protein
VLDLFEPYTRVPPPEGPARGYKLPQEQHEEQVGFSLVARLEEVEESDNLANEEREYDESMVGVGLSSVEVGYGHVQDKQYPCACRFKPSFLVVEGEVGDDARNGGASNSRGGSGSNN